jgi:hypothetical protein
VPATRRFPHVAEIRTDVRRRLTRYLRPSSVVVFEYRAWESYLLRAVCPNAARVRLTPGERADRLLAAIPAGARLVFMHIDLSVTDGFLTHEAEFLDGLAARGITVLNMRATDIRKRTMHDVCRARGLPLAETGREGPPDEMVVVKTNLNCGGAPERRMLTDGRQASALLLGELNDQMHDSTDYQVCRRGDVPEAAWSDPSLVVERFIENPDGVLYRATVLGRATRVAAIWSDDRIKKSSAPVRKRVDYFYWQDNGTHVPLGPSNDTALQVVETARRLGEAMGVDYHGTDCVMDADGALIPIDINKTPWWGDMQRPAVVEHLRRGLDDLIGAVHMGAVL